MSKKIFAFAALLIPNGFAYAQPTGEIGKPVPSYVDNLSGPVTLEQTMAQKHFSWRGVETPPEAPVSVKLSCYVQETGELLDCKESLDRNLTKNPYADVALRAIRNSKPAYIDRNKNKDILATRKYVPIEIRIDPADVPKIDPELVALTPISEFAIPRPLNIPYPPQARRNELEARVVVRCLVELDFSLSCAVPPNYQLAAPAFESDVIRYLLALKIGPETVSKQSAAGKRFQLAVNFTLPQY
jgi:hypothetical protein